MDLDLDKLVIASPPAGLTHCRFAGQANLKNVSLSVGPDLTDINGTLIATGEMGEDFSIDGKLAWSRVLVENHPLNDVKATLSRPLGDPVFRVENIVARFHQGSLIGRADIDSSRIGPAYGVSLTAQDVSLGDFLNAASRTGGRSTDIQGSLQGNFSLAGRLDDATSRYGGGTVVIEHAQMLKLPLFFNIVQATHRPAEETSAFQDVRLAFTLDGKELILDEIDLRGQALSMVGAGRVRLPEQALDIALLVGSSLRLPRIEVLSEFVEGLAREIMEVHVEGTLAAPTIRAEVVRSVRKAWDAITSLRRRPAAR